MSDDSKKTPVSPLTAAPFPSDIQQGEQQGVKATSDYSVGYGKPPKQTQFKKGQSGNPRGRPPKTEVPILKLEHATFDDFFEREYYRLVRLVENGKTSEMPIAQAVHRKMATMGLQGNRVALQNTMKMAERKEEIHYQRKVEHYKLFHKIKEDGEKILRECERLEKPPPELIPHPDDIELDILTYNVKLTGPINQQEVFRCEYYTKLRDHAYCMGIRACGNNDWIQIRNGKPHIIFGVLVAHYIEIRHLPKRYRWKGNPLSLALDCNMPKREWDKRIRAESDWLIVHANTVHTGLPSAVGALISEGISQKSATRWFPVESFGALGHPFTPRALSQAL